MAFQRESDFVRRHAAAVVGHFDQVEPAARQPHGYVLRAGIDGVFDQFLERRRRALDHFTRGDAVDEALGQAANSRHCSLPSDETASNSRQNRAAIPSPVDTIFWPFATRLR